MTSLLLRPALTVPLRTLAMRVALMLMRLGRLLPLLTTAAAFATTTASFASWTRRTALRLLRGTALLVLRRLRSRFSLRAALL